MKTKEEINRWLRQQKWYDSFIRNNKEQEFPLTFDEDTIKSAFYWSETEEGFMFWSEADDKFREWFSPETSKPMKTKEQILKWLDKQPWKNEFYENHFKHERGQIFYNDRLISSAFTWNATERGNSYWAEIDKKYQDWYDSSDRPMSWEEYCRRFVKIDTYTDFSALKDALVLRNVDDAFEAYKKLIILRNTWIDDHDDMDMCYKIVALENRVDIIKTAYGTNGLSFADKKTVREFIETFKDLLETAKPLP